MNRIIGIIICFICALSGLADNRNYFYEAETAFAEGNYENAAKLYQAEYVMNGTNVETKIKSCLDCIADRESAQRAIEAGDIARAKEFYGYVLKRNPSDKVAYDFVRSHQIPEWQKDCWIIPLDNNEFLAVQKSIGKHMSYDNALAIAVTDSLGGFSDWRLPSVDEMKIISNDSRVKIDGNFWCFDKGTRVSSNSQIVNGVESAIRLMNHHKAYHTRSNEAIEIVDEWQSIGDNKQPLCVHELAFLKVRRHKGDGVSMPPIEKPEFDQTKKRTITGDVSSSLKVETTVSRSSYCK